MAFDLFKTLSLKDLGEGWEECYLKFSYLSALESKEFVGVGVDTNNKEDITKAFDKVLELLQRKLVDGKAVKDGKVITVSSQDLAQFPVEVLNKSLSLLVGVTEQEKKV